MVSHPKLLQTANLENWEEGRSWRSLWALGSSTGQSFAQDIRPRADGAHLFQEGFSSKCRVVLSTDKVFKWAVCLKRQRMSDNPFLFFLAYFSLPCSSFGVLIPRASIKQSTELGHVVRDDIKALLSELMVSGFRTSPDFSCSFVTFTTRWLLILPINNWEQIPLVVNLMDVCLDGLLCYAGISRLIGRKAFPSQCLSFAHKCLKFVLVFPWGQCRFPE